MRNCSVTNEKSLWQHSGHFNTHSVSSHPLPAKERFSFLGQVPLSLPSGSQTDWEAQHVPSATFPAPGDSVEPIVLLGALRTLTNVVSPTGAQCPE